MIIDSENHSIPNVFRIYEKLYITKAMTSGCIHEQGQIAPFRVIVLPILL
jgi:hypothetical protein